MSAAVINDDPNRHLQELDTKVPLVHEVEAEAPESKNGHTKVKVARPNLDYLSLTNLKDRLAKAMEGLRASGFDANKCNEYEADMKQHIDLLRIDRDNYLDCASALDNAASASSWFNSAFYSLVVFVLDVVAFTFGYYVLQQSLFSQQDVPPLETPQMFIIASILAIGTSVGMKMLAPHAVKSNGARVLFWAAWILIAIADIDYLRRQNIGNVAYYMTGLLVVMSGVTYHHAVKANVQRPGRKQALAAYSEAYRQYQRRLHQWEHALKRLRSEPQKGLADILQADYFDFS